MRRAFLCLVLGAVYLTGTVSPVAASRSDETLLVALTNQARAEAGLRTLKVDPVLAAVARWRSQDMADRDYFGHRTPDGRKAFVTELQRRGYCYRVAGENIGRNNFAADATAAIHAAFLASPSHRGNILGATYQVVGVGMAEGSNGMHYWTVLFAEKCPTVSAKTSVAKRKHQIAVVVLRRAMTYAHHGMFLE